MLSPLFASLASLLLASVLQQPDATPAPTAIPPEAAHMVNPVKPTPESQARAKKIYGYECLLCHGPNGNGKGDIADMKLKDLTDPATQKDYTDGELFYLIKNGKGLMTAEGDRVSKEEAWNLVLLVRSFAKKTSQATAPAPPAAAPAATPAATPRR